MARKVVPMPTRADPLAHLANSGDPLVVLGLKVAEDARQLCEFFEHCLRILEGGPPKPPYPQRPHLEVAKTDARARRAA